MNKSLKWDGREKTADRLLMFLPAGLASWGGGAKGIPREFFIYSVSGGKSRKVPNGARVTIRGGKPIILRKGAP